MLRYLTKRRWNILDVVWLGVAIRSVSDGHIIVAIIIVVAGAIASVALECCA